MKILTLILALVSIPVTTHSTDIYQFIVWNQYTDHQQQQHTGSKEFQKFLNDNGLKPIKVIYHHNFLTKGKPDPEKIKKIANFSKKNPNIPISFDIEVGNKFKPQTILPIVNQTLDLYHEFGGIAPVGIYGTLPQHVSNREPFNKTQKKKHSALNTQYESIATKVDFLSPVIYNFWLKDFSEWKKRTSYNLSEGRKYAQKYNLKLIPYFSSSYLSRDFPANKVITPLSEQEMKQRLEYIQSQNVDGIIIWDTSIGMLENGEKPTFDINKGFGKALFDFQAMKNNDANK